MLFYSNQVDLSRHLINRNLISKRTLFTFHCFSLQVQAWDLMLKFSWLELRLLIQTHVQFLAQPQLIMMVNPNDIINTRRSRYRTIYSALFTNKLTHEFKFNITFLYKVNTNYEKPQDFCKCCWLIVIGFHLLSIYMPEYLTYHEYYN